MRRSTKNEEIILPDGVCVVERTSEIELSLRNKSKWLPYAQKIKQLTGTQSLALNIGDLASMPTKVMRNKITWIRQGIRKAWMDIGGNPKKIRTGLDRAKGILYIWAN